MENNEKTKLEQGHKEWLKIRVEAVLDDIDLYLNIEDCVYPCANFSTDDYDYQNIKISLIQDNKPEIIMKELRFIIKHGLEEIPGVEVIMPINFIIYNTHSNLIGSYYVEDLSNNLILDQDNWVKEIYINFATSRHGGLYRDFVSSALKSSPPK